MKEISHGWSAESKQKSDIAMTLLEIFEEAKVEGIEAVKLIIAEERLMDYGEMKIKAIDTTRMAIEEVMRMRAIEEASHEAVLEARSTVEMESCKTIESTEERPKATEESRLAIEEARNKQAIEESRRIQAIEISHKAIEEARLSKKKTTNG